MDGHLEKGKNMVKMRNKVHKEEVAFEWTREWQECACSMYACKHDLKLIRDYINHEISRISEIQGVRSTFVTIPEINQVILQAERNSKKTSTPTRPIHHVVQKVVLSKDARFNVISLPFVVQIDKKSGLKETFV